MIQQIEWAWEEAFCKFGFDDGDGWNGTYLIQEFIEKVTPVLKKELKKHSKNVSDITVQDVLQASKQLLNF